MHILTSNLSCSSIICSWRQTNRQSTYRARRKVFSVTFQRHPQKVAEQHGGLCHVKGPKVLPSSFLIIMSTPQRYCLPYHGGDPLRTRSLSPHSTWNSWLRTMIQNRKSAGLGVTEYMCCVDQAVSFSILCLFPPWWSGENKGLQAKSQFHFSSTTG